jgi:alpha-tubulin suppressor-like RCC1 family protein
MRRGQQVQENIPSLIKFPGENQRRIDIVACGGEHIFALSKNGELFGWGRNDQGQLGVGYISECIAEP